MKTAVCKIAKKKKKKKKILLEIQAITKQDIPYIAGPKIEIRLFIEGFYLGGLKAVDT